MADFPDVDPAAIATLADGLRRLTTSVATIGRDAEHVRDSVLGHEKWDGGTAGQWRAVVTDRVGDAGLTNEVLGDAATTLSDLASQLQTQKNTYQRLLQVFPSPAVPDPVPDPESKRQADACAARAITLLENAGRKLSAYALLAGDIHARPVADRTPGIADWNKNKNAKSSALLAILFGSVTDNREAGTEYEQLLLRVLGLGKNTTIWRPDPAFEGRLTPTGLARGTIPDAKGDNFLLEIKGTNSLAARYQLRLLARYSAESGKPLWIAVKGKGKVSESVRQLAEETNGGVVRTDDGQTWKDLNGNDVKIGHDKTTDRLSVKNYARKYEPNPRNLTDQGGAPSPGPDEPSGPENPNAPEQPPGTEPVGPDEPGEPPIEVIDPE